MKSYKTITINGKQKRLHRYIMECYLGRELTSDQLVHHINGDRHDNRLANLQLVTRGQHKKLHPEVGKQTRFKNKYNLDRDYIFLIADQFSYDELAKMFNCSVGAIQHVIGKKPRKKQPKVACKYCGEKAYDRNKELCRKHYKQEWRKSKRKNA